MKIFKSKEHIFNDLEVYDVDRSFLNLQKYIKNFKFDLRWMGEDNDGNKFCYSNIGYDYLINKRRVRFSCTKRTIKNFELYENYYDNEKSAKSNKGYIGLPSLEDMRQAKELFPFRVLEMESSAYIKEKRMGKIRDRFIKTSKIYYLWILYQDQVMRWDEELIKDFKKTADNLIKETIKNLKKIK